MRFRVLLAAAGLLAAPACRGPGPDRHGPTPSASAEPPGGRLRLDRTAPAGGVGGGWEQLDRAVAAGAASAAEGIVASTEDLGPRWRVYHLVLPDGTPARVEAHRGPDAVELRVTRGRFDRPDDGLSDAIRSAWREAGR